MNITYLLGAGASFEAIPIVEGIPKALNAFASEFNPGQFDNLTIETKNSSKYNLVQDYILKTENKKATWKRASLFYNNIISLKYESENHKSIDTYAKKLFLKKDFKSLQNLKAILSCFFLYLQTNEKDNRYDSFFASIIEDLENLPNNLKILSWNYDSQLEISFDNFIDLKDISKSKKRLNTHSKGDVIYDAYLPNQFCVYKINGTTNFIEGEFRNIEPIINFNEKNDLIIDSVLRLYESLTNVKNKSNMSFAWEDFNTKKGFYPNLKKSVLETEILVVIGYSFPFFNRNIDKFILNSMPNLKKVYVQDPRNANIIIDKIKELIPWHQIDIQGIKSDRINFKPITYADQFFIPIEF